MNAMSPDASSRKAAIAAFKERKVEAGIYAVRCAASSQVWVGRSPNVDTVQTRLWFMLRTGSKSHPEMQAAWDAHGEGGFSFEVLERLDEEQTVTPYVRDATLKERLAHWRQELAAGTI
jgi:hypothetical protein